MMMSALPAMKNALYTTISIWRNYSGRSMFTSLFLMALLFLWITEKDRTKRIVFVYAMTFFGILFFFPVFSYVSMRFFLDNEVYYRLLWLVPMGVMVCYGAVRCMETMLDARRKVAFGVLFVAFIMLNGSLIYRNPLVTRAENLYHLPQKAIVVADALHQDGDTPIAVVPADLLQSIRQYDTTINLAYGREMLIDRWKLDHKLYDQMEAAVVDDYNLADTARQNYVDYIVLHDNKPIDGSIERFGFKKIKNVSGYDIYISTTSRFYK